MRRFHASFVADGGSESRLLLPRGAPSLGRSRGALPATKSRASEDTGLLIFIPSARKVRPWASLRKEVNAYGALAPGSAGQHCWPPAG